ncbi:MAG: bifunctional (p)ppGpp synthetase/guanosine-3',5'-bis(diphosphate) 3'-pyrophosphohydrolase [Synergistaceae bacterium]|jgi:GTP pyrophosphokinase|nr:bifunctional (p)ppGpp synthetase/guanosine-3',5'-bis(diphosphate) 3'-pyrophosphohydrolase [Synergistaceae bacterium]
MNATGLTAGSAEMKSILRSVPVLSPNNEAMEIHRLRDSFFGRLPEAIRTDSVRNAWQDLWAKAIYLSVHQLSQLGKAFTYASEAHGDQKRASGEPYMVHPIHVAAILAELQLDCPALCAALLHDVLEDTKITIPELSAVFGDEVATMVDGVTKLGKFPSVSTEDYQWENLVKMFFAAERNIRVILIKLADRLHNMRTLSSLGRDKQKRIAEETLNIFAGIAHRLGMYRVKSELEDLAFKYLYPEFYNDIRRRVRRKLPEREKVIKKSMETLEALLNDESIPSKIQGRTKHFYGIYEKMKRKKLPFDEVYDILAIRVLVEDKSDNINDPNNATDCYKALGFVHKLWAPLPGQIDDYIAKPKDNGYQSLHTTVMAFGAPLEVQIRTKKMNALAEEGVAAHWIYKSNEGKNVKLKWMNQLLEVYRQESLDSKESMDAVKNDVLTSSEIYALTPKGDNIRLSRGTTVLDFAYAVHTEVGHHCVGARISNRMVPLDTEVRNGDVVEIITKPNGAPVPDWMHKVKSTKARSKIKSYLKQVNSPMDQEEKLAQRGWEAVEKELKKRGLTTGKAKPFSSYLNKVAQDMGVKERESLLAAVGSGSVGAGAVAQQLALVCSQPNDKSVQRPRQVLPNKASSDFIVDGNQGLEVARANCCKPVPGDEIVGRSTRLRGITVHRKDCPNLDNIRKSRVVQVFWNFLSGAEYSTWIKVVGRDRKNLIPDVTNVIVRTGGSVKNMKFMTMDDNITHMKIELRVKNLEHVYEIAGKVNAVRGVTEVERGFESHGRL